MVELIDILRAKSKNDEHYLLKEHIKDTLERAIQIWEFVNKNEKHIEYEYLKSKDTFKNLAKALILHDLGKIDYGFQKRVFDKEEKNDENEEWMKIKRFFISEGKKYPVDFGIKDHEILSVIHTAVFLGNDEYDKRIRTAILLHHYNKYFVEREQHITRILDDYPQVREYISFMIQKRKNFEEFYRDLLAYLNDEFKNRENGDFIMDALKDLESFNFEKMKKLQEHIELGIGVSQILPLYDLFTKNENETMDFFVFLGLLRRCDYSASAGPEVSAEKPYSIIEDIMADLPEKIKNKLKQDKIWQEEIVKNYRDDDLVLIAPTGSGKTEFALLWAREKGKKLLYTLPLRVALNDLYIRFSGKEGYFEKEYVDLLHSTAFIEYLKGESKGEDISIGAKLKEVRLFASPILFTTPDQVFLSSLKYYGFDKLLSLYPTSTVVIDEIQAYDPEMAAIIIKTLQMIKKVKGNILVITATFPPYFDSFLVGHEYGINLKKIDLKVEKHKISQDIKNYDVKRHKICLKEGTFVRYEKDENSKYIVNVDVDKIKEIIESDDHKKDNVLIIVNNVMKAIELFKSLKNNNFDDIELLHSRLMEKEKKKRIAKIKEFISDEERKGRIIVVSTQLVEASVDFDFDVLITEISPIDSQVQRWGRVYRNRGGSHYDKNVPNIYIFTDVDVGTSAIYHPKEVLEKTKEVIRSSSGKLLGYEEERRMIGNVYNTPEIKSMYENQIKETLRWLDYYQASKKSDAQRIFRKLAGIQLVIPKLMIKFGENEHIKALGEKLVSNTTYESWKELTEDLFGESYIPEDKLRILQWMYEYSIPVPEYAIHGYLEGHTREFLGFHILEIKDEKVQEIKDYGIDVIKNQDLDEWLDERSRFI